MVETEASADRGFAIAPDVPRKADSRRRKEPGAVVGESRMPNHRIRLKDAVSERVI